MFQILLIRPGVTEYDQQGRIQGTLDIPLCEDGRKQVEAMIEQLRGRPIEMIYTGPGQSATQTAEVLGEALDIKVKEIDKLQNLNYGLWQGMLVNDVKKKQPTVYRQWEDQPETICPPHGETINAATDRLQAVVAKLMKKHKTEGIVAVVLPEPLASLLRHLLKHDELGDLWHARNEALPWEIIDVVPAVVESD